MADPHRPPYTTSTPMPTPTPASSSTMTSADEKPPKHFLAWAHCVENYNAKLLDGKRRTFRTDMLVGAEEVLARLYHEHTKSKLYTPRPWRDPITPHVHAGQVHEPAGTAPGGQRRQRSPDATPGQRSWWPAPNRNGRL